MRYTVEHEVPASNREKTYIATTVYEDNDQFTWSVAAEFGCLYVFMYEKDSFSHTSKIVYGPGRWLKYTEEA